MVTCLPLAFLVRRTTLKKNENSPIRRYIREQRSNHKFFRNPYGVVEATVSSSGDLIISWSVCNKKTKTKVQSSGHLHVRTADTWNKSLGIQIAIGRFSSPDNFVRIPGNTQLTGHGCRICGIPEYVGQTIRSLIDDYVIKHGVPNNTFIYSPVAKIINKGKMDLGDQSNKTTQPIEVGTLKDELVAHRLNLLITKIQYTRLLGAVKKKISSIEDRIKNMDQSIERETKKPASRMAAKSSGKKTKRTATSKTSTLKSKKKSTKTTKQNKSKKTKKK